MSKWRKLILALEIWSTFAVVHRHVRRMPLPQLVEMLRRGERRRLPVPPDHLGRVVDRRLTVNGRRPTCLVESLVLFRLLYRRGHEPKLVIGLTGNPSTEAAHAWVEIEGQDVGPPPGRGGHLQLARFG